MSSRRSGVVLAALLAGVVFGVTAQILRQIRGPLMDVGAATAPWLTIGFALACWAAHGRRSLRDASVTGVAVMAAYLFAWLVSYHVLFAERESVGLQAAWREAAPWLAAAAPACVVLGVVAARAGRVGIGGDICVAAALGWSVPEIISASQEGWRSIAVFAVPTAAVALLPLIVVPRRVSLVRVAPAAVALGGLALVLSPILSSQIHS